MTCDIIIPTYNNAPVVAETLAALARQRLPSSARLRLIVSDDGSSDATPEIAKRFPLPASWKKIILRAAHAGAGAARNRALERATADLVVFLGADILLQPTALAHHVLFHQTYPALLVAALGMVKFDPRLPPSPLMQWMEHGGQQNDFDSLLGQTEADPRTHWYGSHLSLKGLLARKLRFPEYLTSYGWEDLSLGRQAFARGVRLFVIHQAIGHHHHLYRATDIAARQRAAGLNMSRFQAAHSDTPLAPKRSLANHLRRWLFIHVGGQTVIALLITFLGQKVSLPRAFLVFTANEFWKGVWRSEGGFLAYLRGKREFLHPRP